MAYTLSKVLAYPAAAAEHLLRHASVYGVSQAMGRRAWNGIAVLELTLDPLPALAAEGYPRERIRLVILPPGDQIYAYPLSGRGRQYKHRNPWPRYDLCLQYNRDDPALRWLPSDGLEPLVTLVYRHLLFEEAWRRTGTWPSEDAPHGDDHRRPHPVLTIDMRKELRRWARTAS